MMEQNSVHVGTSEPGMAESEGKSDAEGTLALGAPNDAAASVKVGESPILQATPAPARRRDVNIGGIGILQGGVLQDVCVNGIGTVQGDVRLETLRANGILTLKGRTSAGKVRVNGFLRARSTLEATLIEINGGTVLETVNADRFECLFDRTGAAEQILGDEVVIRHVSSAHQNHGPTWLISLMTGASLKKNLFRCTLIECTRLKAEYLEAGTVRGHDIVLGPGCIVDAIEYSGSFTAHASCVIGSAVQV